MAREVYRERLAGYFKNAMSSSNNGPVNHGGLGKEVVGSERWKKLCLCLVDFRHRYEKGASAGRHDVRLRSTPDRKEPG